MKFKDLREKYRSKFPTSLVAAAVKIALDMGGNMTGAYKKIEAMKRGLGDDPAVKDALRLANEEYNMRSEAKVEVDMEFIGMMNNMMKHKHGSPAFKKAKQEIEDYMSKKYKKK
jgi:hypothetical protein|tara:strand:- start:608 stop:949 length:342 start_codon:yes stop_codon:yes gene_type:complete